MPFRPRLSALTCAALSVGIPACAAHAAQDDSPKANQKDKQIASEVTLRASKAALLPPSESNEKIPHPKRIEDSYPLESDAEREKSTKLLQQLVVDLLALFNQNKEAHWNLSGPLYLPLHEFYQEQADFYRKQADVFAERVLSLGYSVDGRYSTIAKTTKIPDFPAGYVSDNESLKLLVDRVTVLQKEVYQDIRETEKSDPPTSNKLQDLAYAVDHNLWQMRIHLKKPGGLGQDLPWAGQQMRDRSGN